MTLTLREQLLGRAAADSALLALLGAGAHSLYPRLDDMTQTPDGTPHPVAPWALWQELPATRAVDLGALGGFRWRVYDQPEAGYWAIEAIISRLQALYPRHGGHSYADPDGAHVLRADWTFTSGEAVDQAWQLNQRWAEWQWRRLVPGD